MKSSYFELWVCKLCEEKFPEGHLEKGFCFYCMKKLEKIKKKHNV